MALPSRNSTSRKRWEGAGKIVTVLLFVLGVIASVFLMLSKNLQTVHIGLVIALWAVTLGVWAIARYRRGPHADRRPPSREPATLREYEAQLRVDGRSRDEESEELAALRAELAVLRQNLQRLFDSTAPADRRTGPADLFPMPELPSAEPSSKTSDGWDPWQAPLPAKPDPAAVAAAAITPVFEPNHPRVSAFASPYDDPVTAETMAVPPEFWQDAPPSMRSTEQPEAAAPPSEPLPAPPVKPVTPAPASTPRTDWFGSQPVIEQPATARRQPAQRTQPQVRTAEPARTPQPDKPQLDHPQRAEVRRLAPKRARATPPKAKGQPAPAGPKDTTTKRASSNRSESGRIERAAGPSSVDRRPAAPRTAVGAHRQPRIDDDCPTQKLSVAEIMANLKSEKGRSR